MPQLVKVLYKSQDIPPPQSEARVGSIPATGSPWPGKLVEEVLAIAPWFEEHARRDYGHLDRDALLKQIAGDAVRLHRIVESNVRLQNQLSEWVRSCYCRDGGAKCLLCETRDLLASENPQLSDGS